MDRVADTKRFFAVRCRGDACIIILLISYMKEKYYKNEAFKGLQGKEEMRENHRSKATQYCTRPSLIRFL
jgi:hypothetical protein